MDGCIDVTGAFIGVEVDGKIGSSHDAKGIALPISHYLGLGLLVGYQLHIHFELSINISVLIDCQGSFEETHFIDMDCLILSRVFLTTFLMINLRVRKLLFSSISDVLEGSMPLRNGFFLALLGSDFIVKKGTAQRPVYLITDLLPFDSSAVH